MFKKYSSINELEESFEKYAVEEYSKEDKLIEEKKNKAIEYLMAARIILNGKGLHRQAYKISLILSKFGAEELEDLDWEEDEPEDIKQ